MNCKVQVGFKGQRVIGVTGKVNPDLPDTDIIMFGETPLRDPNLPLGTTLIDVLIFPCSFPAAN